MIHTEKFLWEELYLFETRRRDIRPGYVAVH